MSIKKVFLIEVLLSLIMIMVIIIKNIWYIYEKQQYLSFSTILVWMFPHLWWLLASMCGVWGDTKKCAHVKLCLSAPTFRSLCAIWPAAAVSQVRQPGISDCWFEDMAVVQALDGPKVAAQIFHRLNMVLLLCGEDRVESLQLVVEGKHGRDTGMEKEEYRQKELVLGRLHILWWFWDGDFNIIKKKLLEQLELTPKIHNVKMQCRHPTEIQNDKGWNFNDPHEETGSLLQQNKDFT